MSNNMYDILGKLNGLTPKQEAPKTAQPLYESVEARGSIVAGVKTVEQKLREQYEAAKEERETLKTKHGTIYKGGTYGNADYDSEAGGASNAPKPTRGRPAAGKDRVAKVAKVKGPKGRPKKNTNGPTGGSAPKGDIFGRTTGSVPTGKKGTVVKGKGNIDTVDEATMSRAAKGYEKYGKQGMQALAKAGREGKDLDKVRAKYDKYDEDIKNPFAVGMAQAKKEVGLGRAKATGLPKKVVSKGHEIGKAVKRGMNESISLRENPETLQHIISKYRNEVKRFMNGNDLDHDLYEALFDYYFDAGEIPYGTAKGRTGDPYEWISQRFDQDVHQHVMDETSTRGPSFAPQHPTGHDVLPPSKPGFLDQAKAFGHKALNTLGHGSDEELKAKLRRDMGMQEAAELNELAKLAGLTVSEANDGNLANNAKPYDKVTRGDVIAGRLGKDEQGGKEEVDEADMEEGNEFSGELAKAKAQHKDSFDVDGKTYPVKESQLDECSDMSPIGSMAQEMQKQEGRISVNTNSSSDGNKSISISADGEAAEQLMAMLKMAGLGGGQAHAQQAEIVIAHEAKEYGDTDVEEPEEYVNSPREKISSVRQSPTTGMAGGTNDLNKSKAQDPATANKAANPKTKVMNQVEDVNPLNGLGAKLMAEYQSIKLQK